MENTFITIKQNEIYYRLQKNETLDDVSLKFNVDKNYILKYNNIVDVLQKGDVIFLPGENIVCHVVGPLDSLTSIATKYNTTVENILSKNKIETLFIGQKIYI